MTKRNPSETTALTSVQETDFEANPATPLNTFTAMIGRGQSGKSTMQRFLIDRASLAGRTIIPLDADTTNASMTRTYADAVQPSSAAAPVVANFVNEKLAEFFGGSKSYMLDLTGQDKTFERAIRQGNIRKMQERTGKKVVIYQLFSPNLDHLSAFEASYGQLGDSIQWILCLNYGLADDGDEIRQFQPVRDHPSIRAALDHEAEIVVFPRNPVLTEVEALGLSFAAALAGMSGRDGQVMNAWDINRLETWMETVEVEFEGVRRWLP
jgi:hypothetical protein